MKKVVEPEFNINPVLYSKSNGNSITIRTRVKWYKRLWYVISNPITYIFVGLIRY